MNNFLDGITISDFKSGDFKIDSIEMKLKSFSKLWKSRYFFSENISSQNIEKFIIHILSKKVI